MTILQVARLYLLGPLFGLACLVKSLFLPRSLSQLRYGHPIRPRLPTYVGWGQAVHPDILQPDGTDRPFVLAFTPYPFQIDAFENPSIVVSNDGLRFRTERKGINPLVPAPPVDHNNDPDILIWAGSYCFYYLETLRPERQNLVLLRSTDRLSWTRITVLSYDLRGPLPEPLIVSPALSSRGDTLFLHYVNASTRPHRIEFLTSRDPAAWEKSAARPAVFDHLAVEPWHIDVSEAYGYYYMLVCAVSKTQGERKEYDLYIARSTDLEHWTFGARPVFIKKPFRTRTIYRSSGFVQDGDLFVYFCYESPFFGAWWIGIVRNRLEKFFPAPQHVEG